MIAARIAIGAASLGVGLAGTFAWSVLDSFRLGLPGSVRNDAAFATQSLESWENEGGTAATPVRAP